MSQNKEQGEQTVSGAGGTEKGLCYSPTVIHVVMDGVVKEENASALDRSLQPLRTKDGVYKCLKTTTSILAQTRSPFDRRESKFFSRTSTEVSCIVVVFVVMG